MFEINCFMKHAQDLEVEVVEQSSSLLLKVIVKSDSGEISFDKTGHIQGASNMVCLLYFIKSKDDSSLCLTCKINLKVWDKVSEWF